MTGEFPGAWQNMPLGVRAFLEAGLLKKSLEIHEGPAGLIEFLYRGVQRPDLTNPDFVHKSGAVRWTLTGKELWPLVLKDAETWLAQREARAAKLRSN